MASIKEWEEMPQWKIDIALSELAKLQAEENLNNRLVGAMAFGLGDKTQQSEVIREWHAMASREMPEQQKATKEDLRAFFSGRVKVTVKNG